jgi:hypothetical protein
MRGHGEKRSRKREQALAALLANPTVAEAAQAAGVGESTLRRWLADPAFRAEYRDLRRQVLETAVGQIQGGAGEAVDALRKALTSSQVANRIRAAKVLLDYAVRGLELFDLVGRIEELEAKIDQERGEMNLKARLARLDQRLAEALARRPPPPFDEEGHLDRQLAWLRGEGERPPDPPCPWGKDPLKHASDQRVLDGLMARCCDLPVPEGLTAEELAEVEEEWAQYAGAVWELKASGMGHHLDLTEEERARAEAQAAEFRRTMPPPLGYTPCLVQV